MHNNWTFKNTTITGDTITDADKRQVIRDWFLSQRPIGAEVSEAEIDTTLAAREAEIAIEEKARQSRVDLGTLPGWAAWTGAEAAAYINTNVLNGMTREQVEAWVDTNVKDLATAKTALKLIGDELIDLRGICENLARAVMYLRDIEA